MILLIFNIPLAAIVAACIAANAISHGPVLVVNAPANAVAIPANIWIVAEAICSFFDFSKPSLLLWSCWSAIPSKIVVTKFAVEANALTDWSAIYLERSFARFLTAVSYCSCVIKSRSNAVFNSPLILSNVSIAVSSLYNQPFAISLSRSFSNANSISSLDNVFSSVNSLSALRKSKTINNCFLYSSEVSPK